MHERNVSSTERTERDEVAYGLVRYMSMPLSMLKNPSSSNPFAADACWRDRVCRCCYSYHLPFIVNISQKVSYSLYHAERNKLHGTSEKIRIHNVHVRRTLSS